MKLKKGDKVKIKNSNEPTHTLRIFMKRFIGKTVVVRKVHKNNFTCTDGWFWNFNHIDRLNIIKNKLK